MSTSPDMNTVNTPHKVEGSALRPASHGEQRVRITFNPNDDSTVNQIKTLSAGLIDFCHDIKDRDPRLAALAETAYEQACMWAVKLATTPEPATDEPVKS